MHVCNLGNLEIDLSVTLILVMLVIWIRGGYVFSINGCAVSGKVSLHATVALPTIGAEHIAIFETYKETIWLRGLYSKFRVVTSCITIYYDSQSVICLTKD